MLGTIVLFFGYAYLSDVRDRSLNKPSLVRLRWPFKGFIMNSLAEVIHLITKGQKPVITELGIGRILRRSPGF